MADGLDLRAAAKVAHTGQRVVGQVVEGGPRPAARRLAGAALVGDQHGHAVAREVIGEGPQRVTRDTARPVDHHDGRTAVPLRRAAAGSLQMLTSPLA